MNENLQLRVLQLQERLRARLRHVRDPHKVLVWTLRAAQMVFEATAAAVAVRPVGRERAEVTFSLPAGAGWDEDLLTAYLAEERPEIPTTLLLSPIERRGRNWAVLALERAQGFDAEELRALFSVTQQITDILETVDERRVRSVRRKIEQKIADRQEPKDVIYDILHGLRSLTRYDHSATLYAAADRGAPLRLFAEQIAWAKAKSRCIGKTLELPDGAADELRETRVRWFHRGDSSDGAASEATGTWRAADGGEPSILPSILEHPSPGAPPASTIIYAPIVHREGALALLVIRARRPGVLDAYEAGLVGEFRALTSLAIQFALRTESLQEKVLKAERKHGLANLTRGIAHDINNAVGAMLPLLQQMREDVEDGELEPQRLDEDLASLESSLQTCRRIFGGMLSAARGSRDRLGNGNLRRSIDEALSVLQDSLRRRDIVVERSLPDELPLVRGHQGDLTQLFLNLCSNARDAMPAGGTLRLEVTPRGETVEVAVEDTGGGIPTEARDRLLEPFFTTKSHGHGLGLAICRSILWDMGGDIRFEPRRRADGTDEGTRVVVTLPVLEAFDPAPTDRQPSERSEPSTATARVAAGEQPVLEPALESVGKPV